MKNIVCCDDYADLKKKKALSALEPEGISPLAYPGCMR